jgi:hypothetical protein
MTQPDSKSPSAWHGKEKVKLIVMGLGLLFVVIAYVAARRQEDKHRDTEHEQVPAEEEVTVERVFLPAFDPSDARLTVRDRTESQQVVLEGEALNLLQDYARLLRDAHFEALGVEVLDRAQLTMLMADPEAHRTRAYRVRGTVLHSLRRQRASDRPPETIGLLDVEGGTGPVHFIALDVPEGLVDGEFVRFDGLFMKVHRTEEKDGWVSAPLLVGNRAIASWPMLEAPTDLARALVGVEDDTVLQMTGINSRTRWELFAYARDLVEGDVDWEAAPELSNEFMVELAGNPAQHRGEAVRLPISTNLASWTRTAGENPLRLEEFTTGWIGNWNWTSHANVIRYFAPFSAPELSDARFVMGRGFFFKIHAYEPRDGGIRTAPVFVMTSIVPFVPQEDTRVDTLFLGVAGGAFLLVGLIVFLLSRDRKQSRRLREDLIARRRARRQKA